MDGNTVIVNERLIGPLQPKQDSQIDVKLFYKLLSSMLLALNPSPNVYYHELDILNLKSLTPRNEATINISEVSISKDSEKGNILSRSH